MEHEIIQYHQKKIFRNHTRRTANLLKLGRYKEAEEGVRKFSGIVRLWDIQSEHMREKALAGSKQ